MDKEMQELLEKQNKLIEALIKKQNQQAMLLERISVNLLLHLKGGVVKKSDLSNFMYGEQEE